MSIALGLLTATGCVSHHWRLFRLDSLQPDQKGNFDQSQLMYGTIGECAGWKVQLSVIALAGAWRNENMETDTFGVCVRMWRVDSASSVSFSADSLDIITFPDSICHTLDCVINSLDSVYSHSRSLQYHFIVIPKSVNTIVARFTLEASDLDSAAPQRKKYECRLLRFDRNFQVFSAVAD